MDALTPKEQERYARQIGPGVLSLEGQQRLKGSTVFVSRCGGMGGPASLMLAMAGVGRLILAHGGKMISPDLNRQVLGSEAVVGKVRGTHFAEYLRSMNRFIEVEAMDYEPDDQEAKEIAERSDLILACPPTFEERLRLNHAAAEAGLPFIDAAQWGMSGSLIVCRAGKTACLECLYPQPPPFEELFPVVGAISSAIGSLAALEAIKILSGCGEPMLGKMWMLDQFHSDQKTITLERRSDCHCCGAL